MDLTLALLILASIAYYGYTEYLDHKTEIARIQAGLPEEEDDDQNA